MFFDIFFYIWIFIESFIFTSNLYEESQNDLAPFILDFHGFIENDSFFHNVFSIIYFTSQNSKKNLEPFYEREFIRRKPNILISFHLSIRLSLLLLPFTLSDFFFLCLVVFTDSTFSIEFFSNFFVVSMIQSFQSNLHFFLFI